MSDVSQDCVALSDGTLSPDMRVNYEFGLVLGVNEFRQEQNYFLGKDYLYNRELHGYGIASGLQVSIDKVGNNQDDVQISVHPGMAIDKWGRTIVVRDTQCARLAAWLAKWEQDSAKSSAPVKVSDKLDKGGNGRLYVVVSHDECLDMLVPVAGQLCGNSETTQAQSRIRDFYNIELRWDAPNMPAWDATRCFAKLMSLVQIVPELPHNLSDEQKIIDLVSKLDKDQPCPDDGFVSATDPNTRIFRLPTAEAREALDRIFAIWTTAVRPKFLPDLLTTDTNSTANDAAILLGHIDFTAAISSGISSKFAITNCEVNKYKDNERPLPQPILLHSQLMQELLLLRREQKPEREFATLEVLNAHTLRVWLHHTLEQLVIPSGETVDWSQYFQLKSDAANITISRMAPLENAQNVFDLTTVGGLVPGARVELTFVLGKLTMQSGRTLQESINTLIYDYVGHDRIANTITTAIIAPSLLPMFELVTISTVMPTPQEPTPHLSLWFHTPGGPVKLPPTIEAQRFVQGAAQAITFNTAIRDASNTAGFSYDWELRLADNIAPLAHKELLSFAFNTDTIHVSADEHTLTNEIQDAPHSFVGYDGIHTLYTFYEVDNPPSEREFATLEVLNAHNLRFWLHHPEPLTLDTHGQALPLDDQFRLKSEGQTLSIASIIGPQSHNSFILVTKAEEPLVPGARIELAILLDGLATDDAQRAPLQERINTLGIEYVGHDRAARTITAYTTAERLQTLELVTLSTVSPTDQNPAPHLSLWFHTQSSGPVKLPAQITGQRMAQGASQDITFATSTSDSSGFSYVWELRPEDTTLSHKDLLSFALNTDELAVGTDQRTLTIEIQATQRSFIGYDGDHTLYTFYEVDSPPLTQPLPPPGPSISDILNLPALPFVTITPVANAPLNFELWFHLSLDAASNTVFISGTPALTIFAELGGSNDKTQSVSYTITGVLQRSIFTLALDANAWTASGSSPYLRFVFAVDDQKVQSAPDKIISLREYSTEQRIKFEGFNGNNAIVVYVRIPSISQEGHG